MTAEPIETVAVPADVLEDALVALFGVERFFEVLAGNVLPQPLWEPITEARRALFESVYGPEYDEKADRPSDAHQYLSARGAARARDELLEMAEVAGGA
jgi:hypothetical protein